MHTLYVINIVCILYITRNCVVALAQSRTLIAVLGVSNAMTRLDANKDQQITESDFYHPERASIGKFVSALGVLARFSARS